MLKTRQNPIAQRIIKAMEKPPHLTYEDVEALRQSIEEGKMPVKFDSPFEPDEREEQSRLYHAGTERVSAHLGFRQVVGSA